jgi:hypothetical protein
MVFSWDKPIEEELLEYLNAMIIGWKDDLELNENLQERFFGNSMRARALGYLDAYESVKKHVEREISLRPKLREDK